MHVRGYRQQLTPHLSLLLCRGLSSISLERRLQERREEKERECVG
jgi:hypothetical protein